MEKQLSDNIGAVAMRRWRAKNPERARAIENKHKLRHIKWRQKNKPFIATRGKIYRAEVKKRVFDHYGRRCVCCGECHQQFLALDHIAGDGNKHRKETGCRYGGFAWYLWIIRNKFPPILQVLCFNCNWAKGHGGCPHQTERLAEATCP